MAAAPATIDQRLANLAPSKPVAVVVELTRQFDALTGPAGREARERGLRRVAATTQPRVAAMLAPFGPVTRLWIVNAVSGRADARTIRRLRSDPAVARVTLDRPTRRTAALEGTPERTPGVGSWGLAAARVPAAWSQFKVTGAGVTIGSIDTGVNPRNPAIAGRVVAFRDFIHGRKAAYDDNGHGTHTISTMVGGTVSGVPIGVAPGARVIVAKAMDQNGVGPGAALLAAAEWMSDPDGDPATDDAPDVVNNSWSAPDPKDPWFRSTLRNWIALGIVPVFAAGNDGSIGSPAGYPDVITVGAIDANDNVPSFSGRGEIRWRGAELDGSAADTTARKPDLTAPGVDVVGAYGDGFLSYTGTSMASPHVAGVVALMRQADPSLTPAQIADVLRRTARDVGPSGWDRASGAGTLDARAVLAAVTRAPDAAPAAPRLLTADRLITNVRVRGGSWITVTGDAALPTTVQVVVRNLRTGKIRTARLARRTAPGGFRVVVSRIPRGTYRIQVNSRRNGSVAREAQNTIQVR